MTTIGVNQMPTDRLIPVKIPNYSYKYPCTSRIKLAGVKTGIYNPDLPSFRNLDRDNYNQKLPDEHCRTSTTIGPKTFNKYGSSIFPRPNMYKAHGFNPEIQNKISNLYGMPEELHTTRASWSAFLDRAPERFEIRLPELTENKGDFHFSGYAARYLRPEITGSWKYSLKPDPGIDNFGQRPLPNNVYNTFRSGYVPRTPWKNP